MQYGFRRKKLYSIREYSPFIVAQVPMGASSGPEQRTAAFRGLAAYLFGRNETETKMQMTTPVFSSSHSMQFVLPVETEDDAPSPQADSEVQLQQVCFRRLHAPNLACLSHSEMDFPSCVFHFLYPCRREVNCMLC